MTSIWRFIQEQLLGMRWLDVLAGRALFAVGFDPAQAGWRGRLAPALRFFAYDSIKIFILLATLIFLISCVQSFFPPERTRALLGGRRGLGARTLAALLGTVTPFCSCSSIPLFIGFTGAGLPIGVTFSFLISSPLVDLGSLVLLASIFGWRVAAAYVSVGLLLAVAGGSLIGRLRMERYLEDLVAEAIRRPASPAEPGLPEPRPSVSARLSFAAEQMGATVRKVWPYVLAGVGIGAVIHNWIPASAIQAALGARNPLSPVLAALVGVPMYADIFGTIPIAEALYAKGVGLGTIMSFMMAVTALSLPSIIMLRRAVKPPLLALFVGIVTAGIILIGYLFNALQSLGAMF